MAVQDLLTSLFNDLGQVIEQQIGGNVISVTNVILPLMLGAISLYCLYIMFTIIYGNKEYFIMDFIKTGATLSIVSAFVWSTPYYIQYVVPFVLGAGDDISSAITGSPSSATALDSMINGVKTSLDAMIDKMQWGFTDDWSVSFQALYAVALIYIGSFIFIFYAAAFLLVAKFMVGLLLSVGTLFFCFAFFPATRGMFQSWIGQCLNYIMLNVFYTITIGILNKFILSKFELDNLGVESSFQIILVFFISVFIIQQISSLTSILTGGVGINGLTGAANSGFGKIVSGGQSIGGGAKNLGGGLINKFRGTGSLKGA
ncbi:TriE protein [Yersinia aldovae]|uniref:type IV secretion system protein n=1 Tax=Yersinia aldovae TaxID=29483 RepID=UPI0005EA49E2|nr:type IV secretion system protein [Yersinia aldovae]CNK25723.1 TriE protein [Yersinia aldovae]